jgi:hypothetical protein
VNQHPPYSNPRQFEAIYASLQVISLSLFEQALCEFHPCEFCNPAEYCQPFKEKLTKISIQDTIETLFNVNESSSLAYDMTTIFQKKNIELTSIEIRQLVIDIINTNFNNI